jgi:hypothetical protein
MTKGSNQGRSLLLKFRKHPSPVSVRPSLEPLASTRPVL